MGPVKNGGVGTASYLLAKALGATDHDVTIFFSSPEVYQNPSFGFWRYFYHELNVDLRWIDPAPFPLEQGHGYASRAMEVYIQLRTLDFDVIIFPEMHGLAHYCLQAKHAGTAFHHTQILVMFHGPTSWAVRHNQGLPTQLADLSLDFMEKTSCLMADQVFFATNHAQQVALEMGYIKPDQDAKVAIYPFDQGKRSKIRPQRFEEICFFGRIETRKGIQTFLDAILKIRTQLQKQEIRVRLLGSLGTICGEPAADHLKKWMLKNQFFITIENSMNREEALADLRRGKSLVILPSLAETMGYTLIECIENQIPFACSDIEPFLEVLQEFKVTAQVTFPGEDPEALSSHLRRRLASPQRPIEFDRRLFAKTAKRWVSLIENAAQKKPKSSLKAKVFRQNYSLCIPFHNRPEYLAEILETVSSMTRKPMEIIVHDDASSANSRKALLQLQKKSQDRPFKVLRSPRRKGPSHARNCLAKAAVGDYLFFLDDDNLPVQDLFLELDKVISRQAPDVIVGALMKFNGPFDLENMVPHQPARMWFPIGRDFSMNLFQNLIGDANFCIRRSFYETLGGFDETFSTSEDHEFLLRASLQDARIEFVPDPLIYYRLHDNHHSDSANNHQALLKLHRKIDQVYFQSSFHQTLKLMLAWTYQKEIIAGPPAGISGFFGLKMPRLHPLTAENKVSLNQFAKCLAGDFEIGKSALRVQLQTSKSPKKNVRFKGGIFKLQTWAAKEISLWTNAEDPPRPNPCRRKYSYFRNPFESAPEPVHGREKCRDFHHKNRVNGKVTF